MGFYIRGLYIWAKTENANNAKGKIKYCNVKWLKNRQNEIILDVKFAD
jgi:hypothetical protein